MPFKKGDKKPEGSGRKPGAGNLLNKSLRDKIDQDAVINFLNDVACGREVTGGYKLSEGDWVEGQQTPTVDQRLSAAATLIKKFLPDLKAVELAGADGKALTVNIVRFSDKPAK